MKGALENSLLATSEKLGLVMSGAPTLPAASLSFPDSLYNGFLNEHRAGQADAPSLITY